MTNPVPSEMNLDEEQLAIKQSYDDYPYESYPYPLSHPDRLHVLAALFGLEAQSPDKCRVLELGCGSGGNLIPLARQLPGSQFFGIDLSSNQVDKANSLINKLGLKNIKIERKDILELTGRIRKFDYIICHGVYSWVPGNVQEKILQICKKYLNENGVAYISYNTLPGWHMRESVRRMMQFHTANLDEPQSKIDQSRALLKFLVDSVDVEKSAYGKYLKSELDILSKTNDTYLMHEHLERNNQPVYFYEFCEQADKAGLQYLAESEFHTMLASNFPAEVAATLGKIGNNIVQQEQYMDFLRNRTFRSSLLCHKSVVLNRNINASIVKGMRVSALPMHIVNPEGNGSPQVNRYVSLTGMQINIASGLPKTALEILSKNWPLNMAFGDLCKEAEELSGISGQGHEDGLAADILKLYTAKAVELHTLPPSFVISVSDRPETTDLVRAQASQGYSVTNMRHEVVNLNEPTRKLVLLLDGKNSKENLLNTMAAYVQQGELKLHEGETEISDEGKQRQYIQQFIHQVLGELAKRALLVS